MSKSSWLGTAALILFGPGTISAQTPSPTQSPFQPAVVQAVRFTGNTQFSDATLVRAMRVRVGEPWTEPPDAIASRVIDRYHEDGYTFAKAKASFDDASGVLAVAVEEGVIDAVEFDGVADRVARAFRDEFALRAGDVFNATRARQALDALLRQTRGAIRPGRTFDLIERNGERVLVVGLREPSGRFRLVPDLGEREDWFSSVDGFVPSLGFGAAVFDHEDFNHTYLAGHISLKAATGNVGVALGGERPLFAARKLFLGAEYRDLTASDDQWQISSLEASLAAVGPRRSYRDYYRRQGVQFTSAWRPHRQVEMLLAWRGERQSALATASDFSFWNSDESFRPNLSARDGRLSAVVLGASIDGRGYDRESLGATYRRHQLDSLFGDRLNEPEKHEDAGPIWRVDWTSELSSPGTTGGDFDFRRHIVNARARIAVGEYQDFGVRAIGGWSDGVLPPQRQFAIGGIGSVHGYDFKSAVGDSLHLLNLEYEVGWRGGLKLAAFFDAGRVDSRLSPVPNAPWMKGVGWGVGLGEFRIDFGYPLDALPRSPQLLLRFGRTF